ncbi:MAG: hypothetical protein FWC40_00760 [Proteobacteria bacterium]|nr:hypothetical protein [Pseudomonadota bacterium]
MTKKVYPPSNYRAPILPTIAALGIGVMAGFGLTACDESITTVGVPPLDCRDPWHDPCDPTDICYNEQHPGCEEPKCADDDWDCYLQKEWPDCPEGCGDLDRCPVTCGLPPLDCRDPWHDPCDPTDICYNEQHPDCIGPTAGVPPIDPGDDEEIIEEDPPDVPIGGIAPPPPDKQP